MSRTKLWVVLAFVSLLAGALVAAGCGGDDDDGGGGGEPNLIEEGQISAGTDTPFPPFEIGQPPDNFTGYDPGVFNEVAKRIGLPVKYQDTSFDTIFRDTAQGKFDVAVAASTITEGRERTVDFSDPYYRANQALTVPKGSDIQTTDDLDGKTVGAQDATTGEAYVQDETDAGEVRGYPEGPDSLNALRAGQVDAVVIDEPVAEDAVKKFGDLEITQIPTGELYGFAFAQDNDALREQVNDALAEMKDDGTIEKLYEKYFKTKPPSEVLEGTHEPS
jgi:polar amino acid transport system substrate-binding protein